VLTLILAAGRGSRLHPLTATIPKALVLLDGVPLLDRLLASLTAGGVTGSITAVTGYRGDQITRPGMRTRHHPAWDSTTMVGSLLAATEDLVAGEDVLVVYGDIVVEPRVLAATLRADPAWDVAMPVNSAWHDLWSARMSDPLADAESLRLDPQGRITQIGGPPTSLDDVQAQYMGILRLSPAGARALVRFAHDTNAATSGVDMTAMLSDWIAAGQTIHAVPVHGGWLEVDTVEDHQLYHRLAAAGQLDRYCRLS
jgi:choline kinase